MVLTNKGTRKLTRYTRHFRVLLALKRYNDLKVAQTKSLRNQ